MVFPLTYIASSTLVHKVNPHASSPKKKPSSCVHSSYTKPKPKKKKKDKGRER
jgi:hypothetical protein